MDPSVTTARVVVAVAVAVVRIGTSVLVTSDVVVASVEGTERLADVEVEMPRWTEVVCNADRVVLVVDVVGLVSRLEVIGGAVDIFLVTTMVSGLVGIAEVVVMGGD